MTANAGYHLFSTGDVLTAAQVQYNLQNQTIMYFASSAARTSALSGVLVEGMFSYLADTNSTEYYDGAAWQSISNPGDITAVTAGTGISGGGTSGAVTITNDMATTITTAGDLIKGTGSGTYARLGIGSTGQVLTVAAGAPSWATPSAGASGLTLISSTSFTTSSAHSVNSCFSATYANYRLVWTVSAFSASNVDFLLRLRVSGTDATTNYVSQLLIGAATTAEAQLNTSGTDDWTIGSGSTNNAYLQSGSIDMFNPYPASATQLNSLMNGYYGANNRIVVSNCINTNATSYDGITLLAGSGTITGTLRIYGYQNS